MPVNGVRIFCVIARLPNERVMACHPEAQAYPWLIPLISAGSYGFPVSR